MMTITDTHARAILAPDLYSCLEVGVLDADDIATIRAASTCRDDGRAYLMANGGGWVVTDSVTEWIAPARCDTDGCECDA